MEAIKTIIETFEINSNQTIRLMPEEKVIAFNISNIGLSDLIVNGSVIAPNTSYFLNVFPLQYPYIDTAVYKLSFVSGTGKALITKRIRQ